MAMADKKVTSILMTMILIVIGLALTGAVVAGVTGAQYGRSGSETFIKLYGAGTSKACTLSTDGIIRAIVSDTNATDPSYITVTTNVTQLVNWSVTSIGTYSAGAVITVGSLTNNLSYLLTITYHYKLPAIQVTLLGLIPLFWVIAIVAIGIVAVYYEFQGMN